MKKKQPQYDSEQIRALFLAGLSDKEIAAKLGRPAKTAWRTIQGIRVRNGWTKKPGVKKKDNIKDAVNAVAEAQAMTKIENMPFEDRIEHFKTLFKKSQRFDYMFTTLNPNEISLFQEEYFKVLQDVDDISMTEEQSIFLAIYELVLALRAQKNRKVEEDNVEKSREGTLKPDDPGYLMHVSEQYDREYTAHMKNYQKLIEDLKLSRKQRLDREIKTKKSILDYVYELADDDAQTSVAKEIRRLSKLEDEELARLIKNGYLFGIFSTNKETS